MGPLSLLLVGIGTGTYGVLIGAGGGVVIVPLLLVLSDMEPQIVAGTTLALVSVNSISGSVAYRTLGLIDRRSGLLFAGAAIPGSIVAPFVLRAVAGDAFRVLFGLLLVALAVHMLLRRGEPEGPGPVTSASGLAKGAVRRITMSNGETFQYQFNEALATSFNVVLGFISAFFGTGGGFLRTPVLVAAFSFPVRVAAATSIFALSIYATIGTVVHASLGHVDWYPTFIWAGVGLLAGGQMGARLSTVLKGVWILRLLVILLMAMGLWVTKQGIWG